jgi:hypothetical protein
MTHINNLRFYENINLYLRLILIFILTASWMNQMAAKFVGVQRDCFDDLSDYEFAPYATVNWIMQF